MRQMVVWFAVFCAMKWRKSFHALLSTTSPPLIKFQTTPSIFMANYSPPSSGRGWGWGWKTLVSRLCFPYTISPLIINNANLIIVLSRNSIRVVLLIARGWRGTSLSRGNVRKEIQRRRCWAFSVKARLQWNLLWRINQRKRNTYGVVPCKPYVNPG